MRTYVCVCHTHECQFALTCMHAEELICHVRALTRESTYWMPSLAMEDREERRFLTMEDRQDNVVGLPQRMRFAESSTERSWRLAASQCTVEAKRARREQEKVQKKKARCGESSQARYTCKLCSLFMFDSTVVVLEL